ncbi:hypothetical protein [Polynucleobacter arcticus]|uniref:Uncharacterized protein n=1 Tax=Polynucleobacter arcticus TaxID=1743165 RepID=A0A6M9PDM8_9BURK|nr:hypothetical protein [Polynucleobacter arcticus]QKM60104.1 hypothetical protein DN92_03085 [Polynucleobacter arcticus]
MAILFVFSSGFVHSENVSTQVNTEEAGSRIIKTQSLPLYARLLDPKQVPGDGNPNNLIGGSGSSSQVKSSQVELPLEAANSRIGGFKPSKSTLIKEEQPGLDSDESMRVIDVSPDDEESSDVVGVIEPESSPSVSSEMIFWPVIIVMAITLLLVSILFAVLWRASSNLVSGFKRSNYVQLRAYLTVRTQSIHLSNAKDYFHISLEIQNYGQTPAHNIDIASGIYMLDHPLPISISYPEMYSYDKKSYLLPGDTTQIDSVGNAQVFEELSTLQHYGKTKRIYVLAYIGYQDVDGKHHFTLSCHTITELIKAKDSWVAKFEEAPIFNNIGSLKELDEKNTNLQSIYSRVITYINKVLKK